MKRSYQASQRDDAARRRRPGAVGSRRLRGRRDPARARRDARRAGARSRMRPRGAKTPARRRYSPYFVSRNPCSLVTSASASANPVITTTSARSPFRKDGFYLDLRTSGGGRTLIARAVAALTGSAKRLIVGAIEDVGVAAHARFQDELHACPRQFTSHVHEKGTDNDLPSTPSFAHRGLRHGRDARRVQQQLDRQRHQRHQRHDRQWRELHTEHHGRFVGLPQRANAQVHGQRLLLGPHLQDRVPLDGELRQRSVLRHVGGD